MTQATNLRCWCAVATWVAVLGGAIGSIGCTQAPGATPNVTPAAVRAPSVQPAGEKLYIVNQGGNSITVVDQSRLIVDTVIDLRALGFSANARPLHVAVDNGGRFWFVTLNGDNRVLKFDRNNTLLAQVAMEAPGLIAIDPQHDSLYVSRSTTANNPPPSLAVITRRSFILVAEQHVGIARPHAIATSHDGKWIYTASLADNKMAAVEVATGRVTPSTIAGAARSLVTFAVSPDGHTMVTADEQSNSLLVFDLRAPPPLQPVREIALEGKPWAAQFTPDGWHVLVTLLNSNEVVDVGMASNAVLRRFDDLLAQPFSIFVRRDGRFAFVASHNSGALRSGESGFAKQGVGATDGQINGWLSIFNLVTGKLHRTVPLGVGPTGMGAAK